MSVKIDAGYSLTDGKHAHILHAGNSFEFTVDQANTTNVADTDLYSEAAVENELTIDRYKANSATWTIDLDLDAGSQSCNCIAIGSDDIATNGQTITIQRGTTTIDSVAPTVDSPLMFFFASQASLRWRILGSGGTAASIYNVKIGNALAFERPFYSGFSPARMNRATDVIGNVSRNGELMGRSVKRTILNEQYDWQNLTYTWVRNNLDGPTGLIQSLETKPAYIAWRPSEVADTSFIMRGTTQPPQAQGIRDLWSFSMSAEVHAYE